jgi:hypothetical protein
VPDFEFFVGKPLQVSREHRFESCNAALESFGVNVIKLATAEPIDAALAEKCRHYRHSIEAFVNLPFEIAIRIPSKSWTLRFWLCARGLERCELTEADWLQQILEQSLLPIIAKRSQLPEYGYHSLWHLMQIALFSALIAWEEGVNPIPAMLAGLLHDAAREGDEAGAEHAAAALDFTDELLKTGLRYLLAPEDWARVRFAISRHPFGEQSDDPIIGACWDADRLRLAWERGVSRRFFSTHAGLRLASAGERNAYASAVKVFGPRYFS